MSHKWVPVCCALFVVLLYTSIVLAGGPKVSAIGNKHNLSAQNTLVKYYAQDRPDNPGGQQICIFCHTPHNSSSEGPLWNRKGPDKALVFVRYTSNTLKIRGLAAASYDNAWQPNGSSRLCLSCHDGVTKLGAVINSGQNGPILMDATGGDQIQITSAASFHPSTNKMKVGHHPVSFVYATSFISKTQDGAKLPELIDFRLPNAVSMQGNVKLQDSKRDGRGWMQCTTCHDAHQNMGNDVSTYPSLRKITPFWVYSGATTATDQHDAVCTSCHTSLGGIYDVNTGGTTTWTQKP